MHEISAAPADSRERFRPRTAASLASNARISIANWGALAALIALSPACKMLTGSDAGHTEPGPQGTAGRSQLVNPRATPSQPPVEPVQDPHETIAVLEDARSDGNGLLEVLLIKGEPETRERAAVALGRLPYPAHGADVTAALCAALKDQSPAVRSAAAFGLGERGDPAATDALLACAKDPVDDVRARVIEAASRIDHEKMREAVLQALKDPAPAVRIEAALGPHRWPVKPAVVATGAAVATGATGATGAAGSAAPKSSTAPTANGSPAGGSNTLDDRSIDATLIDAVRAQASAETATGVQRSVANGSSQSADAGASKAPITKPALFSLMRRKSEPARVLFLEYVADPNDAETRIFAIQGLGNIAADPATNQALCKALDDADWRVACEAALALGKHPDCESVAALGAQAEHKSAHVRRCVFEALGNFGACKESLHPILEDGRVDSSANVRAAALEAEAKLYGDEAVHILEREVTDKNPLVRAGVASAATHLSPKLAVPMLVRLSKDSNRRVADIAVHGLEGFPTDEARARLRELLTGPDNGLRLAAVEALRKQKRPEDLVLLEQCFDSARGEISSELAFGIFESAAAIGGKPALALLEKGLAFDDPYVRKKAREWITKTFPDAVIPNVRVPERKPAQVPVEGRDFIYDANPYVEVRTSKGSMLFELLPDETPVHVVSFLELVNAHHYDNLTFHRVVPDFVIQGGDVRGDGNGGASWRGDSLRAEFTPRKFLRGSLGMPRNEDPDSGGSQIFVTHRWTPHLDGRYTLFGTLVSGGEVLDAIEVGDTILEIKQVPAPRR